MTDSLDGPCRYDIRVGGHLAARWSGWFDGMTLSPQDDGTTVVHGPIANQAVLHGLLRKLHDLGLPLVSVTPAETDGRAPDQPFRNRSTP